MKTAYQSSNIMTLPERLRPDTLRLRMQIRTLATARGIEISANSLRYFDPASLTAALDLLNAGESIRFVFATRDQRENSQSVTIPGESDADKTP